MSHDREKAVALHWLSSVTIKGCLLLRFLLLPSTSFISRLSSYPSSTFSSALVKSNLSPFAEPNLPSCCPPLQQTLSTTTLSMPESLTPDETSAAIYAWAVLAIPLAILLSFGPSAFTSKKEPTPKGKLPATLSTIYTAIARCSRTFR